MPCICSECVFRKGLGDSLCGVVCEICHIKKYARGQCLRESYWAQCISIVLDGLMLEVEQHEGDRLSVVGLNACGSLINLRELFNDIDSHGIDDFKDTYCVTNCTVAVIRSTELIDLMRSNPEIEHVLLKSCVQRTLPERRKMLLNLGFGDAKTSIRYVLKYLKQYSIPYLTHEQIAMICHRSRQTVTSVIRELQNEEPELFVSD